MMECASSLRLPWALRGHACAPQAQPRRLLARPLSTALLTGTPRQLMQQAGDVAWGGHGGTHLVSVDGQPDVAVGAGAPQVRRVHRRLVREQLAQVAVHAPALGFACMRAHPWALFLQVSGLGRDVGCRPGHAKCTASPHLGYRVWLSEARSEGSSHLPQGKVTVTPRTVSVTSTWRAWHARRHAA